jgi:hypothetical protein
VSRGSGVGLGGERDVSSGGFGLLNSDNTSRPAFTALQNWMTSNASSVNG